MALDFWIDHPALTGALAAAVLALAAWWGDRRRTRRSHPDRVGCMPWTLVFFVALLACVWLGSLAFRAWIAG